MSLINRVSGVANKRRIKRLDSSGSVIESYCALIEREDDATQEGTALTASSLEEAINSAVIANAAIVTTTAATQCECDCSTKVATTAFVWNVLTALGLTKISHNHTNYEGGGSSGSDSDET